MICEFCGKEHNGDYSKRFCSKICARKYSISFIDKNATKDGICIKCGKLIKVNIRASLKTCKCEQCKKKNKSKKKTKHKFLELEKKKEKTILEKIAFKKSKLILENKCWVCGKENCENNFCKIHNSQQFHSLIKYFGYNENLLGTEYAIEEFYRIRQIIYDLYWKENYSGIMIAQKFNYPSPCNITGKIFRYLDIPRRNFSDCAFISIYEHDRKLSNKHLNYKESWHLTWDNKEVYLRSSFEEDYAKELDSNKILYEVEFLRIKYFDSQKQEYRCALPDFYLVESNTIVEIKSDWTLDIQNMKDKFKAYKELGYNTKLILNHEETDLDSL